MRSLAAFHDAPGRLTSSRSPRRVKPIVVAGYQIQQKDPRRPVVIALLEPGKDDAAAIRSECRILVACPRRSIDQPDRAIGPLLGLGRDGWPHRRNQEGNQDSELDHAIQIHRRLLQAIVDVAAPGSPDRRHAVRGDDGPVAGDKRQTELQRRRHDDPIRHIGHGRARNGTKR